MNWEIGIDTYALMILCIYKQITNENPLHSARNNTMLCVDLNGKEIQESVDMCVWIADSLHCTAETNTTL